MPRACNQSCDRCYSIKERCSWVEGSSQCMRCSRLGFTCSKTRQAKKPGRRVLSAAALQANRPNTRSTSLLPRAFPSAGQINLIHHWMSNYETFDRFLLGPAFWPRHCAALMTHLEHSQSVLEHAYLASVLSATYSAENSRHTSQPADGLSTVYRHASTALRSLRELHVTDRQQASTCLVLGTNIMLFAMFQRPENVFTLCRQTLVLVRPVYDTIDGPDPEDFFFLTGTMMLEMVGSLIHGAVPALRFRPPKSPVYVDRYLGLSTSLLQLLHRVGELNSSLSDAVGPNVAVNPMASRDLDGLESTVLAWQPDVPENLCSMFSAVEIAHIFCQVQAMRLCALLLIYRLKIPFGMHDAPARAIAISILTQLQTTLSVTGKAVKFAMLPVLVACVELTTETERDGWLSQVPELVCCSRAYGLFIQGAIRAFWTARDVGVVFRGYNISRFTACSDDRSRARSKDRNESGTSLIGGTAHI
ncbi:uncharacterized protein BO72DRAFT_403741 [Aspergillus fijiensis CBS 313.89]|uniref:Zn(2)-C6 fungal-type domain-containing protein n=1 Tax=Aspergillus fijiensis CBS 313.89 TaxID=1448319 RepID=A0A8G1VY63_9EURO|nr:uncharacterized protein BO72DRAFT_403741 [Aspergillus fijiensis CBS 313.89]RAK77415.1 hypothetical protein BO72DRAFT_403741 [Aspergillus fijiensis CBS 313.89]